MELKRLTLALVLCTLFVVGYSMLIESTRPPQEDVPVTGDDGESTLAEGDERAPGTGVADGREGSAPGASDDSGETQGGSGDGASEEGTASSSEGGDERRVNPVVEDRVVETDRYVVTFSSRGAVPVSVLAKGLTREAGLDPSVQENLVEIVGEFESGRAPLAWSMPGSRFKVDELSWFYKGGTTEGAQKVLIYEIEGDGLRFTKRFRLMDGADHIGVEIDVETLRDSLGNTDQTFHINGPMGIVYEGDPRRNHDVTFGLSGAPGLKSKPVQLKTIMKAGGTFTKRVDAQWVGVASKYFAAVLESTEAPCPVEQVMYDAIRNPEHYELLAADGNLPLETITERSRSKIGMRMEFFPRLAVPGQKLEFRFRFFVGLKDEKHLGREEYSSFEPVLHASLQFACFMEELIQGIAAILFWILNTIYAVVGNYGFAIIILTLIVKLALFPLTRHSQVSMAAYQAKMAKHKPELDRIREKYKNNRQKLNQETLKFMKEKDVSFFPLGGCLPMLATLPIFFGLFYLLRTAPELRQAPFIGWITDLSRPDQLVSEWPQFSFMCLNIYGINLLPILMTVAWFWQQSSMPKAADPQQAQTQQMMKFMPIMFGFMLYDFAAGLSLYWLTNSIIGIIEQKIIKRSIPKPPGTT